MPDSIIIICPACRTKNRVPLERINQGPGCGRCKTVLPVDDLSCVTQVSDAEFDTQVMAAPMPVLVDCWAPWCGPCHAVAPVLEELANRYAGRVKIVKLNLDDNPGVGSRFGISSVPTLMLVKNGQVMETLVGAQPKEILEAAIERYI